MELPVQKEKNCVSRRDRQRELAKQRILFWAGRLQLLPHEVEGMSQAELNQRWQVIKESEKAFERREAEFERWKQLSQLRYLMYEEQRKYNERHGADGTSIWEILALAQQDLEDELQIDKIRGSCERFPSPMFLMEEKRYQGGRLNSLKPLRSVLNGFYSEGEKEVESEEELQLKEVTRNLPKSWPRKQGNRKVQTLISTTERLPHSNSFCEEPFKNSILGLYNQKFNLHSNSEMSLDSIQESPDLGFCPLCAKRHLRLPPRF
ncbi:uncharacterized protein LOC108093064 [Drosophila ficusphila]|uniref:uncharacterized protein LOC108093064 n=1 Tax=Drosophila ficusphila TaxID=30025 RepID=UPI0007E6A3A2|nr:uncharacterized protein LOC108093064 [Drosophila ficusphila]